MLKNTASKQQESNFTDEVSFPNKWRNFLKNNSLNNDREIKKIAVQCRKQQLDEGKPKFCFYYLILRNEQINKNIKHKLFENFVREIQLADCFEKLSLEEKARQDFNDIVKNRGDCFEKDNSWRELVNDISNNKSISNTKEKIFVVTDLLKDATLNDATGGIYYPGRNKNKREHVNHAHLSSAPKLKKFKDMRVKSSAVETGINPSLQELLTWEHLSACKSFLSKNINKVSPRDFMKKNEQGFLKTVLILEPPKNNRAINRYSYGEKLLCALMQSIHGLKKANIILYKKENLEEIEQRVAILGKSTARIINKAKLSEIREGSLIVFKSTIAAIARHVVKVYKNNAYNYEDGTENADNQFLIKKDLKIIWKTFLRQYIDINNYVACEDLLNNINRAQSHELILKPPAKYMKKNDVPFGLALWNHLRDMITDLPKDDHIFSVSEIPEALGVLGQSAVIVARFLIDIKFLLDLSYDFNTATLNYNENEDSSRDLEQAHAQKAYDNDTHSASIKAEVSNLDKSFSVMASSLPSLSTDYNTSSPNMDDNGDDLELTLDLRPHDSNIQNFPSMKKDTKIANNFNSFRFFGMSVDVKKDNNMQTPVVITSFHSYLNKMG